MSVEVRQHRSIRDDIREIALYIGAQSRDAALRFPAAVERTIEGLAEMPGKGSPKQFDEPELQGIRSYAVDGFRNHLIYYRLDSDGSIFVLSVNHGARNLPGLLLRRA